MKNLAIKKYHKLILTFVLGTAVMMSCQDLIKDYELDTNPDFLKTMTLVDYIKQGRDTSLTLYAEAVEYADLTELISEGEHTRVVPTNNAIRNLLVSAGLTDLKDLSPNVVKGLLSYLIFPGEFRSVDLDENETVEGETLSGDPLYLTRRSSWDDNYGVVVNDHARLATPMIEVIRQDYVFMDGVAHVVDYFPTYQQLMTPTDSIPDDVDYSEAQKDTIWVTDEAHAYRGGPNNNYNSGVNQLVSRSGQYRYTFFKFDVLPIAYVEDLTSAKLHFFINQINGSNFVPISAFHETTDDNWTAPTLTWNTMPDFGPEIATQELSLDWNEVNLTGYMQNVYKDEKPVISLGLQLLNGQNITSSSVQIRNSEVTRGIYTQFISLMGPIPSEMMIGNSSSVVIPNNGATVLTKDHFSMVGPQSQYNYADYNIMYSLMETPVNGTLTKYGLPMIKFAQFTQEELASGAIKYVHHGGNGNDTFQLKALDYLGGVYSDLVSVSVNAQ